MPVSPYYPQGGHNPYRYTRSNSSSNVSGLDSLYARKYTPGEARPNPTFAPDSPSNYFRSKYIIPEDGPAKSILSSRYSPASSSGFQLNRYSSSDNVPDTSYLSDYSKLKKSTSTATFPTSNTSTLLKNYNLGDSRPSQYTSKYSDTSLHSPVDSKPYSYRKEAEDRKFGGKYGGESSYANAYLARINKGKNNRPKEINTRDINVTDKPKGAARWLKADRNREEGGSISRNRQVVRLTIKREKDEPQDPFAIKNKTLQTIAQRLIDKYKVPESKPEPPAPAKRRLYLNTDLPKKEIQPISSPDTKTKLALANSSSSTPENKTKPPLQTPPSTPSSPKSPAEFPRIPNTVTSTADEKVDDAALVLQRATNTAETKDTLESWQEVKDAIYAAVLHPDVDIESDEEINKLMKGDEASPEGSRKANEEGEQKHTNTETGKGKAIVGQLKKFVRQQESTRRSRKKVGKKLSRGSKGSKKNKEKSSDIKADFGKDNSGEKVSEKDKSSSCSSELLICDTSEDRQKENNTFGRTEDSGVGDKGTKNNDKIEESVTSTSVGKDVEKVTKVPAANKSSLLSLELIMKSATPKSKVSKETKDQPEYKGKASAAEGERSKTLHDEKDEEKDRQSFKGKRKDERSLLSLDLVMNKSSSENNEHTTTEKDKEEAKTTNENDDTKATKDKEEVKASKDKGTALPPLPESKDKTTGNQGTKIPKIKKKIKKMPSVEDTSGEALGQSGPSGSPPSGQKLLSQSSSLSQAPVSKSHLEGLDTQENKIKSLDSTSKDESASSSTSDKNKNESSKQTSQDKSETKSSKPPKSDNVSKVKKDKPESNAASELGGNKVSKPPSSNLLLPQEPKNEKDVKVEGVERSEDADKGPDAPKLSLEKTREEKEGGAGNGGMEKKKIDKTEPKNNELEVRKNEKLDNKNNDKEQPNTNDKQIENEEDKTGKATRGAGRWNTNTKTNEKQGLTVPTKKKLESSEMKEKGKVGDSKPSGIPKRKEGGLGEAKTISKTVDSNTAIDDTKKYNISALSDNTKTTEAIQTDTKEKSNIQPEPENKVEGITDKSKLETTTGNQIDGTRPEVMDNTEAQAYIPAPWRRGANREGDNSLKGTGCEVATEGVVSAGDPTDALPVKKALKRPRQVVLPPAPKKEDITKDLLKARNILKKPVQQKSTTEEVTGTSKQEPVTPTETTVNTAPWRKPKPLVPANQGDQLLQARHVLKRPVKPKEDKQAEDKSQEVNLKQIVQTTAPTVQAKVVAGEEKAVEKKGFALRRQKPIRSCSVTSSSGSDDEYEGSTVRKKADKPRRPLKPRSTAGGDKTPSPKASSRGSQDDNKKVPLKASPKTPPPSKTAPIPEISVSPKPEIAKKEKEPEADKKVPECPGKEQDGKVNASQSADSGYGSSPSTPLPTTTTTTTEAEVKVEEEEEEVCTMCGTNCHKKCEKQMPNLCGVNQKLLAEALSSVKKGGSTDGTTRALAAASLLTKPSSSSISGSETETTEDESEGSTTDTDSDYFGLPEIRPPLQTCPKFKKYSLDDFNFIKVLGKGSYGKVMLAQQKDSENYFAVKCLKKDVVLEDNDVECTLIERKVLSLGTKHPYLCHLFCTFQTPSHLFFVMEYLTGGDLMFHIQHCGRFDEFRACFYAAEITSGLKFLHNKGIIYRDLKLDNILLDYQGHIRIADFGMCKLQVYLDRYADTFCGTPDYMAPEVIKGQHYNQCVDWWSFGVLLYEMLTGKSPFKGCDEDHLFWLICNDEPFFPKFLSKEASSILKQLLDKDSTRRLGIPYSPYGEITAHPFFKYIDWGKIDRKEVETPYKPRLRHILDVQYFDPLFTKRQAAITPLDESILTTMDQTPFKDFSYTNPNITD